MNQALLIDTIGIINRLVNAVHSADGAGDGLRSEMEHTIRLLTHELDATAQALEEEKVRTARLQRASDEWQAAADAADNMVRKLAGDNLKANEDLRGERRKVEDLTAKVLEQADKIETMRTQLEYQDQAITAYEKMNQPD